MTGIHGQIAFPNASIPAHLNLSPAPDASLPIVELSGRMAYDDGVVSLVITGRPRFQGATSPETVVASLCQAYRDRGVPVLEDIHGPFAIIAVNRQARTCAIAIDRMGIERLAWGVTDGWLNVGTSAAEVAQGLEPNPELNRQALFDFMYSHMVPAPATVFKKVKKLLPGEAIQFSPEGQQGFSLWRPDFSRSTHVDIEELKRETRPVLKRAIERTDPGSRSGSFLSGGLDSSTVTGLLASVQKQSARAFSVGFGVDEFDEMEFARAAAARFQCEHLIYEVTPADIVDLIPRISAAYDEPFGNSSAVPTYCCARLAKEHGVDHLLAGDAGDELFGGNERYVRHRIFEMYYRLPQWMRRSVFEPLAARLTRSAVCCPSGKHRATFARPGFRCPSDSRAGI
ncbi:MAG: asparagine synthase-related protein [Pseudomonadota bacterium]